MPFVKSITVRQKLGKYKAQISFFVELLRFRYGVILFAYSMHNILTPVTYNYVENYAANAALDRLSSTIIFPVEENLFSMI